MVKVRCIKRMTKFSSNFGLYVLLVASERALGPSSSNALEQSHITVGVSVVRHQRLMSLFIVVHTVKHD